MMSPISGSSQMPETNCEVNPAKATAFLAGFYVTLLGSKIALAGAVWLIGRTLGGSESLVSQIGEVAAGLAGGAAAFGAVAMVLRPVELESIAALARRRSSAN